MRAEVIFERRMAKLRRRRLRNIPPKVFSLKEEIKIPHGGNPRRQRRNQKDCLTRQERRALTAPLE